jgi:hypothetical protein
VGGLRNLLIKWQFLIFYDIIIKEKSGIWLTLRRKIELFTINSPHVILKELANIVAVSILVFFCIF